MESENKLNSSRMDSLVASRLKSIQKASRIKPPASPDALKKRKSPSFKFDKASTAKATLSGSDTSVASSGSAFSFATLNQSDYDFPVYPASCTHTASYPKATESKDFVKSMSVQDLPSISKSSGKHASLKQQNSSRSIQGSQKRFWSLKRVHSSKQTLAEYSCPDLRDTASIDGHSIFESDVASLTESVESYYKSYEDIAIGESVDNSLNYSFQPKDSCTRVSSSYGDDLWQEVGDVGGVLQLHECDVSLHIFTRIKPSIEICESCATMNKLETASARQRKYSTPVLQTQRRLDVRQPVSRKRFASSKPLNSKANAIKLTDYECLAISPGSIDGRLILGLADSPDSLVLSNNMENSEGELQKFAQALVIAGPAVRLDLKDVRVIEAGAVLQVQTNVAMKDASAIKENDGEMKYANSCVLTCLQSTSYYGPFKELKSCRQFGNSLQVPLDKSQIQNSSQGHSYPCQIFLVPVVKQVSQGYSLASPWECISYKTFHIGIYGPRRTYGRSTCCVSISSSGFSPTLLKIQSDKLTQLTLRLLSSFHLVAYNIQGYKLTVRPSSSSFLVLETDLSDTSFTEDEMRTESRINKVFVLRHALPTAAHGSGSTGAGSSNRKFTVELKGLLNKRIFKMNCKTAKLKVVEYPSTLPLAVAERLLQTEESSVSAVVESKLHNMSFQWSLALQEAKLNFHEKKDLPDSNRFIFGIRLAQSLKANNTKHRNHRAQASYVLQYQQEEYMPLLSRHTIWVNEGKSKQEWWICYCRHHVGLVRMDAVKVMDFNDLPDWSKTRITVSKLVNALLKPIQHLKSDDEDVCSKLCAKVCDWPRFAEALDFMAPFLSGLTSPKALNREEKISFYVRKYIKHCSTTAVNKQFHREIMRALLYTEHYSLATELIADFCILTVSAEIATGWEELAHVLIGNLEKYTNDAPDSDNEVSWKPAHRFLCYWKERFGDNYKGVIFGLHQALQSLLDSSNATLQHLIECVAVVRSFDALCQYDTRL